VYFGSTTGTAKSFAQSLVSGAVRLGIPAALADLASFDPDEFAVFN
jgi:hypothetical protein